MKLSNKRIFLRPLTLEDAKQLHKTTMDDELRYMTGTHPTFTLAQIEQYIIKINEISSRYDFAICLLESNDMIGELSLIDIDEDNNKAGFRISMSTPQLTGKGYGTEAIQIILKFAFEELNLNRVQLEVYSHNERGIRAYEKVGFKKEGLLRQTLYYNGAYSDEIIMAILKEDYVSVKLF